MNRVELGPFRLVEKLGQGAHASVFRAIHGLSGRHVAIKVLREPNAAAEAALERELAAVAGLSHPNIVEVYDTGVVERAEGSLLKGTRWVALEFATHGALSTKSPRRWETTEAILLQLLSALAHAHARGVIHRDLKPANVLRSGRRLKLADFGLAWALSARTGPRAAGTPAYMAPELIRGAGARIGPWTDLYAVGCLAWKLTTGKPPFTGDQASVFSMHQTDEAPLFRPLFDVPRDFEIWARRLLSKRPESRGDSAALAANNLRSLGDVELDSSFQAAASAPKEQRTWTESLSIEDCGPLEEAPVVVFGETPWLLPRPDWRLAERTSPPRWWLGGSLTLVALRSVPMVGRHEERDLLWQCVRQVAVSGLSAASCIYGAPGMGCVALARWLANTVSEQGVGHIEQRTGACTPSVWADVAEHASRGLVLVIVERPEPEQAATWLQHLRDAETLPVLVVFVTYAAVEGAMEVRLGPMEDSDIVRLCRHAGGLENQLASDLAHRAGGNPSDALKMLRALLQSNALQPGPMGFVAPEGIDWLPLTRAQEAAAEITALLDLEGHDLRPVALAALLDPHAPAGSWSAILLRSGLEPDYAALEQLARAGLVRWTTRWRFASETVARAVLEHVGEETVRVLAVQSIALLPPATLTVHSNLHATLLLHAHRPEEALDVIVDTPRELADRDTLDLGRLAQSQLDLPADDPRSVWLELTTLERDGRTRPIQPFQQAMKRRANLQGRSRSVATGIAARMAMNAGDYSVALELYDSIPACHLELQLHRNRALALEGLGRMKEAERSAREALAKAQQSNDPRMTLIIRSDVADWERVHGRLDDAEREFRIVLQEARAVRWRGLENLTRENLVQLQMERGNWQLAYEELESMIAWHLRAHQSLRRAATLAMLCLVGAELGRLELVEDGLVRLERLPLHQLLRVGPEPLVPLARAAKKLGKSVIARRLLDVIHRTGETITNRVLSMEEHGFFADASKTG